MMASFTVRNKIWTRPTAIHTNVISLIIHVILQPKAPAMKEADSTHLSVPSQTSPSRPSSVKSDKSGKSSHGFRSWVKDKLAGSKSHNLAVLDPGQKTEGGSQTKPCLDSARPGQHSRHCRPNLGARYHDDRLGHLACTRRRNLSEQHRPNC